ncbi:hypothetical protein PV10_02090 [Exophiala mesophila]|uniref:Uncharacterized protein n=1 Tax=Exophiala mesophila TaxID=212818 RepID=A0A0D1ZK59_EXOME|nr:uncharacterized protein PV10_02090 [Exophiala mesophila]KIV94314.1 hypothetical protein PV10_02090 [Exophiala mesophila]
MFFKQSGFKPRTNSQSSQSTSGSQLSGSPPKDQSKTIETNKIDPQNPLSAAAAGRRRSSAADKFGGLQSLKRNSQDDKRAGFAEQSAGQQGVLGGMWNSFTKGT